MIYAIVFIAGFVLGSVIAFIVAFRLGRGQAETAKEILQESEVQRKNSIDTVIESMKDSFKALSFDALSESREEFMKLAKETFSVEREFHTKSFSAERELHTKELDTKKSLIDQQIQTMTSELNKVSKLVGDLEDDRIEKFGELTGQLKAVGEGTAALTNITNMLHEALASTKARGQWGERMAEDVLQHCGLVEGVNYLKQKSIKGSGTRPDFTFLIPLNRKLNMDVKFPWDNYNRYVEADSELEKERFCNDFLKNVKTRIKEVTTREYISPEENTLDCVLLFIPNERIYAFIHEHDRSVLDYGLKNKVVLCSPITLFAVLAVIRQAVDNFNLGQTSNEILSLLGAFKEQWGKFFEKLEQVGKRIKATQTAYDELTTTRRRQLERHLDRIEGIRVQRGIPAAVDEIEHSSPNLDNT